MKYRYHSWNRDCWVFVPFQKSLSWLGWPEGKVPMAESVRSWLVLGGGSPPNIWKTLQKEWFWGMRSGIVLDHDLKFRISSDFNWVQFTFNWFKFTFNWFSFESVRKSIEKKEFQLISIDFASVHITRGLISLLLKAQVPL